MASVVACTETKYNEFKKTVPQTTVFLRVNIFKAFQHFNRSSRNWFSRQKPKRSPVMIKIIEHGFIWIDWMIRIPQNPGSPSNRQGYQLWSNFLFLVKCSLCKCSFQFNCWSLFGPFLRSSFLSHTFFSFLVLLQHLIVFSSPCFLYISLKAKPIIWVPCFPVSFDLMMSLWST